MIKKETPVGYILIDCVRSGTESKCLVVEDAVSDVKAAGLHVIGIPGTHGSKRLVPEYCTGSTKNME